MIGGFAEPSRNVIIGLHIWTPAIDYEVTSLGDLFLRLELPEYMAGHKSVCTAALSALAELVRRDRDYT